jgi:pyruvate dehydrogenase E1 component alpha subunit
MEQSLQKKLFETMQLIRCTEETIAQRYSEGKMRCPTHLSIGQEAVPTALSQLLTHEDFAVSTHRAHAHYLAKGGDLKAMIAEIYGKVTGCSKGKGGSMHLIDKAVGFMGSTAIVGGTIPIGVGLGLSLSLKESDAVSCVYLGDAAVEEGVFYESVNFAVLKNLPVLFICENNLYSVYSPLEVRQPQGRKIAEMVVGMGCRTLTADGNDAEAVFSALKPEIEKVRGGAGPLFCEFSTYRWREHCGPHYDNDIGYRSEEEFNDWKEKDPLMKMHNYFSPAEIDNMQSTIQQKVDAAFRFAEESSFPEPDELTKGIYSCGK